MAEDWTREEVEIIVTEYFEMLAKEQAGISYSKTETRQRILPLLKNRSNGSVEFKNRNISAVLARMGQPYIRGYLPAYNYQKILLEDVVLAHLRQRPEIEDVFKRFAEIAPTPHEPLFETMEETMPAKKMVLQEPELIYRSPVKVNYISSLSRQTASLVRRVSALLLLTKNGASSRQEKKTSPTKSSGYPRHKVTD